MEQKDGQQDADKAIGGRWMALGENQRRHHIYTHETKPGHVTVPHPRKDLPIGTVNNILKQAGLK